MGLLDDAASTLSGPSTPAKPKVSLKDKVKNQQAKKMAGWQKVHDRAKAQWQKVHDKAHPKPTQTGTAPNAPITEH